MKKATLIVMTAAVGSFFVNANPSVAGDGNFSFTFDIASGAMSIGAALTVEASWDDQMAGLSLALNENGPAMLEGTWLASLDALVLSADVTFDIPSASFTRAGASLTIPGEHCDLTLTAAFGNGLGLNASMVSEGVVHTINIGLNLDPFSRVQTDSCAFPFTYVAVEATIPVTDCATVDAEMLVDATGFAELLLSCSGISGLPLEVQFAAILVFEPEAKSLDLSPSFSLEASECVDLYAGLSWDAATHTISGIEIYGIGLRCTLGEVDVRGLWSLDPATIALVKAPYWALLGLVWDLPGCRGDLGEGGVALFFDNTNGALFGIGAIEAEFVIPLAEAASVTIGVALPVSGGAVFSASWDIAF